MSEIVLQVSEPDAIELEYVEAKIKPEVTGHATPTYEQQTVNPTEGTTFGSFVVEPIPEPTDVYNISENGDYNVARYGTARVAVEPNLQTPDPVIPTKQQQIVTADAGYDGLSSAVVEPIPDEYIVPSGWVFDEYSDNGKPTRARFFATENDHTVASGFMNAAAQYNVFVANIAKIELSEGTTSVGNQAFERRLIKRFVMPSTVTSVGAYVFRNCPELEEFDYMGDCCFNYYDFLGTALKRLTAHKNVTRITGTNIFPSTTELIDFSHCTSVPPLSHAGAFDLVVSCRLLVPSALLTEWQNATNWNALTTVTLEGV